MDAINGNRASFGIEPFLFDATDGPRGCIEHYYFKPSWIGMYSSNKSYSRWRLFRWTIECNAAQNESLWQTG